jgi:hypothetical protein
MIDLLLINVCNYNITHFRRKHCYSYHEGKQIIFYIDMKLKFLRLITFLNLEEKKSSYQHQLT